MFCKAHQAFCVRRKLENGKPSSSGRQALAAAREKAEKEQQEALQAHAQLTAAEADAEAARGQASTAREAIEAIRQRDLRSTQKRRPDLAGAEHVDRDAVQHRSGLPRERDL